MAITPASLAKSGTEHGTQAAFFCALVPFLEDYPLLRLAHAIPNGGERGAAAAARFRAEGVKAGTADVFVPAEKHCAYRGIYIEFKKPSLTPQALIKDKNIIKVLFSDFPSCVSKDQKAFLNVINSIGYCGYVAFDWFSALYQLAYVQNYVKIHKELLAWHNGNQTVWGINNEQ